MKKSVLLLAIGLGCTAGSSTQTKPSDTAPPTGPIQPVQEQPPVEAVPALPPPEAVGADQTAAAAKSIDGFSVDLYKRLVKDEDNLIVSPLSVAVALGMTHLGAKAETERELSTVLGISASGLSGDQWHAAIRGMLQGWNKIGEDGGLDEGQVWPEIALANRVFGDKSTAFARSYLDRSDRLYGAPLEPLDFRTAPEPSRTHINDWVAGQTHDRIQDLIPGGGIGPTTRLVLVNAIYFKAQWQTLFQDRGTAPGPFAVRGGKPADVPIMSVVDQFKYADVDADGVQVIELAYGSGPFAMTIVLPDDANGLAAVEAKLDADSVQRWTTIFGRQRIAVKLPRFKIDPPTSTLLTDALAAMGLKEALDPAKADFSGMADKGSPLVISEVIHKAFIEVDEKGTEAAAATAVMMKSGAAPPSDEPIAFNADHPFLFMLRDTKTNTTLFMGRVVDPR